MARQTQAPPRPALEGYPKELTLADGQRVNLRAMTPADKSAMLTFTRSLPPDDLLFLRSDVTVLIVK
jgi:hypothetical protein